MVTKTRKLNDVVTSERTPAEKAQEIIDLIKQAGSIEPITFSKIVNALPWKPQSKLQELLENIPPEKLHSFDNSGTVLFWDHINATVENEAIRLQEKYLVEIMGLELENLVRTRFTTPQYMHSNVSLWSCYNFFEQCSEDHDINVGELISQSSDLPQKIAKHYWIAKTCPSYGNRLPAIGYDKRFRSNPIEGKDTNVYLDAPMAFILTYKKNNLAVPQAVISFQVCEPYGIKIMQIQGQNMMPKMDWRKFLVDYLSSWAIENGFTGIEIQKGIDNPWCYDRWNEREQPDLSKIGEPHLTIEQAVKGYDCTAERLGFKLTHNGQVVEKGANIFLELIDTLSDLQKTDLSCLRAVCNQFQDYKWCKELVNP